MAQLLIACDTSTVETVYKPPGGQAAIEVSRRNLITGLASSFTVFIDGVIVGTLRPFETGRYVVAPGRHRLNVRIGKRTMPTKAQAEFDIAAGEIKIFRTRGRRVLLTWGLLTWSPDFESGPLINLKPSTSSSSGEGAPIVADPSDDASPAMNPSDIRKTSFRRVLKGYDIQEVQSFLGDLARRIEQGGGNRPPSEVTFRLVRNGYDAEEVDAYLDSLGV